MLTARTLVAGIGNIFLGDDGFGVEVVRRLSERPPREHVDVVDFGIRGIDLAYALLDGYASVILVDAAPRGHRPGTLYVLEPDLGEGSRGPGLPSLEAHALVPHQALSMARALGGALGHVRVVACEPAALPAGEDVLVGLSPPVAAAVDGALLLIDELLEAGHA
jgi:hydrogenase maturation protease